MIHFTVPLPPKIALEKHFGHVLLLNTYDPNKAGFRKNKEELFHRLTDSLLTAMEFQLNQQGINRVTTVIGLTAITGNPDSAVVRLMQEHQASHAILIQDYNASFTQTSVTTTKTEGGKEKEAYYDIASDVTYSLFKDSGLVRTTQINVRQRHSSRSVISGLLAAGPDIVANSGDALRITKANAARYISHFFPAKADRSRLIFAKKEFAAVGAALDKNDFELAFTESRKWIEYPDATRAARANYNCAVLMEREGRHEEARKFLQTSLNLRNIPEAILMREDFEME